MGVIKDIIEHRVNTTGVSEPVVVVQGTDRVVIELPGVTDVDTVRRLVGQTGQLDFVPLGTTPAQRRPGPRPRGHAAAVRRRPGHHPAIGQDPNGGLAVDFTLAREAHEFASRSLLASTPGPRRRVLRDHPRRRGRLGAPASTTRSPDGTVQITAADRRLPAGRGQRAGHRPQVRLAAVPDRRGLERADLGDARRPVPQPDPAGRARSASCLVMAFMILFYRLPGVVAVVRARLLHDRGLRASSGSSR